MDATDEIAIVRLDAGDAAAGLVLSTEAHWNQTEADWRFFLTQGVVFGVRDEDGLLIATAALLPYSSKQAWISMVLVTANWRRRGIATRLVDACLEAARKLGITSWLDATPAGAPVYGPLGFTPDLQLRRLRREPVPLDQAAAPLRTGDLAELISRDAEAMGFERSALLRELAGRPGSRLVSNGNAKALVRDGRVIRQIGPLFADDAASALALVDQIVRDDARPVLMDAIYSRREFLDGLVASGWSVERPFQRMRFGRATTHSNHLGFAVAGPEYG
jgi:GNAT superfamily N-acetyltransferase